MGGGGREDRKNCSCPFRGPLIKFAGCYTNSTTIGAVASGIPKGIIIAVDTYRNMTSILLSKTVGDMPGTPWLNTETATYIKEHDI